MRLQECKPEKPRLIARFMTWRRIPLKLRLFVSSVWDWNPLWTDMKQYPDELMCCNGCQGITYRCYWEGFLHWRWS